MRSLVTSRDRIGMTTLNWFITGASSGLGASLAKAAISAGHRVAGTARSSSRLRDVAARIQTLSCPCRWISRDRMRSRPRSPRRKRGMAASCAREQCRHRLCGRDRGGRGQECPRGVRDQRLRPHQHHPSRAPGDARPRAWHHRQHLLDQWCRLHAWTWLLQRLETCGRSHHRRPLRRGRAARPEGADRRAGRISDRYRRP